MKKESLSVVFVRTLLAILLFAGIGTIIVGGWYIIGEYSKNVENNQITKPVDQEVEDYYGILEKECPLSSCYLSSLGYMKENDYKKADKFGRCPGGFVNKRLECHDSLSWCRPIITKNDVLFNTDKIEYQIGEKVDLTIENKFNRNIEFIISLEKYDNKNWKQKVSNILCNNPDKYSCGQAIVSSDSIGKYSWSQKNFGWRDLNGVYRFRIILDRDDVYMPTSVFSNEFVAGDKNNI